MTAGLRWTRRRANACRHSDRGLVPRRRRVVGARFSPLLPPSVRWSRRGDPAAFSVEREAALALVPRGTGESPGQRWEIDRGTGPGAGVTAVPRGTRMLEARSSRGRGGPAIGGGVEWWCRARPAGSLRRAAGQRRRRRRCRCGRCARARRVGGRHAALLFASRTRASRHRWRPGPWRSGHHLVYGGGWVCWSIARRAAVCGWLAGAAGVVAGGKDRHSADRARALLPARHPAHAPAPAVGSWASGSGRRRRPLAGCRRVRGGRRSLDDGFDAAPGRRRARSPGRSTRWRQLGAKRSERRVAAPYRLNLAPAQPVDLVLDWEPSGAIEADRDRPPGTRSPVRRSAAALVLPWAHGCSGAPRARCGGPCGLGRLGRSAAGRRSPAPGPEDDQTWEEASVARGARRQHLPTDGARPSVSGMAQAGRRSCPCPAGPPRHPVTERWMRPGHRHRRGCSWMWLHAALRPVVEHTKRAGRRRDRRPVGGPGARAGVIQGRADAFRPARA